MSHMVWGLRGQTHTHLESSLAETQPWWPVPHTRTFLQAPSFSCFSLKGSLNPKPVSRGLSPPGSTGQAMGEKDGGREVATAPCTPEAE